MFSTPANQPEKREKSKGVCSRVSTRTTARGALSWVPPRSAKTGIGGGNTGAAVICHSSGEAINVRRRLVIAFRQIPLSYLPSSPCHRTREAQVHEESLPPAWA